MIPTTVKVVSAAASRRAFLSTRTRGTIASVGSHRGGIATGAAAAAPPFLRQPQRQQPPRNDGGLLPFSSFSRCLPVLDKVSVTVPTMGDSITEGTIVEWTAQVGQAVDEGDVVALVETDKVTVDIKAEMAGVVVAHFGEVDDTVEVGAALYEIDTEGIASDVAPSASDAGEATKEADPAGAPPPAPTSTPVAATTAVPEAAAAAATAANAGGGRMPAIRFLGKEGWALRLSGASSADDDGYGREVYVELIPDDPSWDPMYGRPPFSEEEMEALLLGGASVAPKIVKPSSGAVFA